MILGFVIILVILGTSIGLLIYTTFLPFLETLGTIKFYNTAYYGAIAGVERAQLITRYKQPGFNGSGGWLGPNNIGPQSDYNNNDLGQISNGRNRLAWTIQSSTDRVPSEQTANIPYVFSDATSKDYNTLRYHTVEKILLAVDTTTDPQAFYTPSSNVTQYLGQGLSDAIDINLRMNPFIYSTGFHSPNFCLCDQDQDKTRNDILVSRSIGGEYSGSAYRINPKEHLNVAENPASILEGDSFVRELDFSGNPPSTSIIFDNSRNPKSLGIDSSSIEYYTLIAPDDSISGSTFSQLYSNNNLTNNYIQIQMVNFASTDQGDIFPFVEYSMDFGGREVADRYYHIEGIGRINDYEVRIQLFKPTTQQNTAGDFTVVF